MIDYPYRLDVASFDFDPGYCYGVRILQLEGCHWTRALFTVSKDCGRLFIDVLWIRLIPFDWDWWLDR